LAEAGEIVVVRQWVAAVGITLEAEDALTRSAPVDYVTALILGSTGIEAALALLASRSSESIDTDSFGADLKAAAKVAGLQPGVQQELRDIRKLRNVALHVGAEVGAFDAARAARAARRLLDDDVPRVLTQTASLGPGKGIPDAVATLFPDRPLGQALAAAQAALPHDPLASMEHSADAMWLVQEFTRPMLPTHNRRVDFNPLTHRDLRDVLLRDLGRLSFRVESIARWTVPLSLGLSPSQYSELVDSLPPTMRREDGTFEHPASDRPQPTPAEARRTSERIAWLVLRLWGSGLLRPETEEA
jgi:hypothetical protein